MLTLVKLILWTKLKWLNNFQYINKAKQFLSILNPFKDEENNDRKLYLESLVCTENIKKRKFDQQYLSTNRNNDAELAILNVI